MFHVWPPGLVLPSCSQVPKEFAVVTRTGENVLLPTTVSGNCGAVVPMPTLVSDVALFTPFILPSTNELLVVTAANAPIAVVLLRLLSKIVGGPESTPRAVL